MKRAVGKTVVSLSALAALALSAAPSAAHETVLRVRDRSFISFDRMLVEMDGVDLVFIGEVHDRAEHHAAQLEVIRALNAARPPVAVGLEMFSAKSQPELDRWIAGEIEPESFISLYYQQWKMPWPLYSEIFLFLREHNIPMLGLNVPAEVSRKVSEQGFGSLSAEELGELPPGLTCDVDQGYMDYIRRVFETHGGNGKEFVHFCEAQLLWDKAMAWRLKEYLEGNPGRTVAVLAGIAHSLKKGIPEQLSRLSKLSYKVVVPVEETPLAAITEEYADYVLLY
jgi:uncharacterized iron-regulated protein